jgi:hypothetical protein
MGAFESMGGTVSDRLDDFAQKAGEAFVAAGRAQTPEQRDQHRASAHDYQQMVNGLRKRGRGGRKKKERFEA